MQCRDVGGEMLVKRSRALKYTYELAVGEGRYWESIGVVTVRLSSLGDQVISKVKSK